MTVDNAKLYYLSNWDIDQLIFTGIQSIGMGATAIFTIPSYLPAIPTYEIQLKISGKWYQSGLFSPTNTVAGFTSFFTYVNGGNIFINTNTAGIARYFVWKDKINY